MMRVGPRGLEAVSPKVSTEGRASRPSTLSNRDGVGCVVHLPCAVSCGLPVVAGFRGGDGTTLIGLPRAPGMSWLVWEL